MPTISIYLQQSTDVADHVLYGVVNAISGSAPNQTVSVTQAGNYGGSIFFGETSANKGPFENSVGKTVRRYTSADWNTKGDFGRPYAVTANVGTIATVPTTSPLGLSFTADDITNAWAVGNVWAIDYHSPYSFGKWDDADKYNTLKTADEEKATNSIDSDDYAGSSTTPLPEFPMRPLFFNTEPESGAKDENGRLIYYQYAKFLRNGEQDIDPLTTKWELKCDTLSRNYSNSAVPLPIPSMGRGDQYYNMLLDIGMRQETINMTGTLMDRGAPTAQNPRLQTLFDIIRTQHSPTMNLNGEGDQGGKNTNDPSNPMSYLRLTIGSGYEPSDYQESTGVGAGNTTSTPAYNMNTNLIVRDRNYSPGGPHTTATLGTQRSEKAYRGLVTQFSANIMGGRPDIWTWNMTFNVVKNEHDWTFSA